MIAFYLMLIGIILGSIIVSLIITYFLVKLISLVGERYAFYLRNHIVYKTGTQGQDTNESINFIIFLKSIYKFAHLNNMWNGVWYPFGKLKSNSKVNTVYSEKECECYTEGYNRSPKSCFHDPTLSQGKGEVNQKGTIPIVGARRF